MISSLTTLEHLRSTSLSSPRIAGSPSRSPNATFYSPFLIPRHWMRLSDTLTFQPTLARHTGSSLPNLPTETQSTLAGLCFQGSHRTADDTMPCQSQITSQQRNASSRSSSAIFLSCCHLPRQSCICSQTTICTILTACNHFPALNALHYSDRLSEIYPGSIYLLPAHLFFHYAFCLETLVAE